MTDTPTQITDNRRNNGVINNDYVIDEITFYLNKYNKLVKKFNKERKKSEKLTCRSLIACLILAFLTYSPFLVGHDLLSWQYLRPLIGFALAIATTLFIGTYFTSRLKGHTRAWSRNRLMRERLEILSREYRLAIYQLDSEKDKHLIKCEQENTLAKLFELETENRITTQQDIVGDYLAANEGTFNWIKGFRK